MRKINWRPFRPVEVDHILRVLDVYLCPYDEKGRMYNVETCDPAMQRPMLIWAEVSLISGGPWDFRQRIEFGFTYDDYVFGWPKKRLSSLPEHEYYWRHMPWLTITDRDVVFGEFTKRMFDTVE